MNPNSLDQAAATLEPLLEQARTPERKASDQKLLDHFQKIFSCCPETTAKVAYYSCAGSGENIYKLAI